MSGGPCGNFRNNEKSSRRVTKFDQLRVCKITSPNALSRSIQSPVILNVIEGPRKAPSKFESETEQKLPKKKIGNRI